MRRAEACRIRGWDLQYRGNARESNPPIRRSREDPSVLKTEVGTSPARASRGDVTPGAARCKAAVAKTAGAAVGAARNKGASATRYRRTMATSRRRIRIGVLTVVGVAVLVLNPVFGVLGRPSFGAEELRVAVEGTWQLT